MAWKRWGIILGLFLICQSAGVASASACSPGQLAQQRAIAQHIASLETQGKAMSKKEQAVQTYRIEMLREELQRMQSLCQTQTERNNP